MYSGAGKILYISCLHTLGGADDLNVQGEVLARWILAAATSSTPVSLRRPVAGITVDTLRFTNGH